MGIPRLRAKDEAGNNPPFGPIEYLFGVVLAIILAIGSDAADSLQKFWKLFTEGIKW